MFNTEENVEMNKVFSSDIIEPATEDETSHTVGVSDRSGCHDTRVHMKKRNTVNQGDEHTTQ